MAGSRRHSRSPNAADSRSCAPLLDLRSTSLLTFALQKKESGALATAAAALPIPLTPHCSQDKLKDPNKPFFEKGWLPDTHASACLQHKRLLLCACVSLSCETLDTQKKMKRACEVATGDANALFGESIG